MKSQRQLQIGENLKRIIADIFLRDDISLKSGGYVTVLEADVSPDAKNAKIFVDIFGNEAMHDKIIESLNKMAPQFRYQMAKKLTLRAIPEIQFVLDKTQVKAMSLEALIKNEADRYEKPKKAKAKK
jgi:ribosome-binding factor A